MKTKVIRDSCIAFFLILFIINQYSCASLFYYKNPEAGAIVNVNGINCSTTCYVDGHQTRGNLFKIPINTETKIEVNVRKNISNGYYYSNYHYNLEANNSESSSNITIEYTGDGKFHSDITVKGMQISFK